MTASQITGNFQRISFKDLKHDFWEKKKTSMQLATDRRKCVNSRRVLTNLFTANSEDFGIEDKTQFADEAVLESVPFLRQTSFSEYNPEVNDFPVNMIVYTSPTAETTPILYVDVQRLNKRVINCL